jgi:hypothetical protein
VVVAAAGGKFICCKSILAIRGGSQEEEDLQRVVRALCLPALLLFAVSVYVLVAIVKKELKIELSLGETLQILSIVFFEKFPITKVLTKTMSQNTNIQFHNQLLLLEL